MEHELAHYLQRAVPTAEEMESWGDLPLRITAYLCPDKPPPAYVTSVRGLIVRQDSLLVMWDDRDQPQLLPGGRCEPGETAEQTLSREILEETGITVLNPVSLGFLHYHHLGPRPADYAYPFPDFLQVVFMAHAGEKRPEGKIHDVYVSRSAFMPVADVPALPLRPRDRPYLAAVLKAITRDPQ